MTVFLDLRKHAKTAREIRNTLQSAYQKQAHLEVWPVYEDLIEEQWLPVSVVEERDKQLAQELNGEIGELQVLHTEIGMQIPFDRNLVRAQEILKKRIEGLERVVKQLEGGEK